MVPGSGICQSPAALVPAHTISRKLVGAASFRTSALEVLLGKGALQPFFGVAKIYFFHIFIGGWVLSRKKGKDLLLPSSPIICVCVCV